MNDGDKPVSGRDAMEQIAKSNEAVCLSRDRSTGEDRIVRGKMVVTQDRYIFMVGSVHHIDGEATKGGFGENGWTVLSRDPWIVGLRTPSTDNIIAAREPTPEEYDEWRELFEHLVRQ